MDFLNSKEVAQILGVNVSTIKRWTEEGKLACERTAGGHRKFQIHHVSRFLHENESQQNSVNSLFLDRDLDTMIGAEVVSGDFSRTVDYLLERAMACDHRKVTLLLNALLVQHYPLHRVFDTLVTPVLHRVGDLWQNGIISVTEEHFASQTIHDALIRMAGVMDKPPKTGDSALLMNMATELHVIPLKMTQILLEQRGFSVLQSGQITPSDTLDYVMKLFRPDRLYISSTYIADAGEMQEEFDTICEIAQTNGINVYTGGHGFDVLQTNYPQITTRLHSFADVYKT